MLLHELLDRESKKAATNSLKAVNGLKLKIQDDFTRREKKRELTVREDKASRAAKQVVSESMRQRHEHNLKHRDEKIRMIKASLTREAQIEQDREMKRIRRADADARRRIQEIEAKMWEEVKKREHDYKTKREAIVRFGQQKEAAEAEAVKEIMRTIDEKLDRSEKAQHAQLLDKVTRVQEHNHDILEKK